MVFKGEQQVDVEVRGGEGLTQDKHVDSPELGEQGAFLELEIVWCFWSEVETGRLI